ncbi:MAG: hypothetical protein OXE76_08135 [Alphaproteobacteria bacterium]|nr:hypothetical protein [Alphaproteobacteria bacterium]
MDLDTLTPGQAARQALAALETLRVENEALAADKACLAAANDALTEERACLAGENEARAARIRRLEHLNLELITVWQAVGEAVGGRAPAGVRRA